MRVLQTTTSTGAGFIALTDTVPGGYQTFIATIGAENQTDYIISGMGDANGNEVEVGYGTIANNPALGLRREKVFWSTNGNNLVNFSAGKKYVFIGPIADTVQYYYPFPDWKTGIDWDEIFLAYDSMKMGTYKEIVTQFGSVSATKGGWQGGVLAPNGMIYGIPGDYYGGQCEPRVIKIDPTNDSISYFGSVTSTGSGWLGGVLAPNGMIYGIPCGGETSILKIDPTTDSVTTFGTTSGDYWFGGVLAANGYIYSMPGSNTALKINPADDSFTEIATGSITGAGYRTGVLAPDGCIYGSPYFLQGFLRIDTSTDSLSIVGTPAVGNSGGHRSCVLGPNGMIYQIPCNFTPNPVKFDPYGNVETLLGTGGGASAYGGVVALNGCIYTMPIFNTLIKIDTLTDSVSTFGSLSVPRGWYGGALAPNGCIYGIPHEATTVLKIQTWCPLAGNLDLNFCLSRYYNKF